MIFCEKTAEYTKVYCWCFSVLGSWVKFAWMNLEASLSHYHEGRNQTTSSPHQYGLEEVAFLSQVCTGCCGHPGFTGCMGLDWKILPRNHRLPSVMAGDWDWHEYLTEQEAISKVKITCMQCCQNRSWS